jgi:hypothetical protein
LKVSTGFCDGDFFECERETAMAELLELVGGLVAGMYARIVCPAFPLVKVSAYILFDTAH